MRALLVLALLARVAAAEDEPIDDYDPLVYLRRSFEERGGAGCYDHLAVLRQRGVPDTTTIYLTGSSENLPRGKHSITHLRVVCAQRMMKLARFDAEVLIYRAIATPGVGADACVERWPLVIASGARPTDRVAIQVPDRRRGGWMEISGTLARLYVKYCENAYTPRWRGE